MSETQTETIETRYGSVDIETVECDSCGQQIGKEQANEFTLGDRDGHACDHCVDEGPISFPPSVDIQGKPRESIGFSIVLWPIILFMGLVRFAWDGEDDEWAYEYHNAMIATLLWTTLPLCLLIYFGVI